MCLGSFRSYVSLISATRNLIQYQQHRNRNNTIPHTEHSLASTLSSSLPELRRHCSTRQQGNGLTHPRLALVTSCPSFTPLLLQDGTQSTNSTCTQSVAQTLEAAAESAAYRSRHRPSTSPVCLFMPSSCPKRCVPLLLLLACRPSRPFIPTACHRRSSSKSVRRRLTRQHRISAVSFSVFSTLYLRSLPKALSWCMLLRCAIVRLVRLSRYCLRAAAVPLCA